MEKEILSFIKYMRSKIKERPQCFMFALLLKCKFNKATLLYNSNHFITRIGDKYYDWDGIVENAERYTNFPETYGDNHIVNHYNAIKDKFQKLLSK